MYVQVQMRVLEKGFRIQILKRKTNKILVISLAPRITISSVRINNVKIIVLQKESALEDIVSAIQVIVMMIVLKNVKNIMKINNVWTFALKITMPIQTMYFLLIYFITKIYFYLTLKTCKPSCPAGYYPINGECLQCDFSCSKCNGGLSTNCTTC